MLMAAVIQPEAFDQVHFENPGYRTQAEMLLRGFKDNGLLVVDPDRRLLNELSKRISALGDKAGQQLRVWLEELQKDRRQRIVVAESTVCKCPQTVSLLDAALIVHRSCHSDTVVVDALSASVLQSGRFPSDEITLLDTYTDSLFEKTRHDCFGELPHIDEMDEGVFDGHVIRLTRFATRLRFYDKQIGHGSSLGDFRFGIGKILGLWVTNAHFARAKLSAEIYTFVQKTFKPTHVIHKLIEDSLVRKLKKEYDVPIALHFKQALPPPNDITHDRYLQTDSVAVYFGKGFSYAEEGTGKLHGCEVKISNGAWDSLQKYRGLTDWNPKTA